MFVRRDKDSERRGGPGASCKHKDYNEDYSTRFEQYVNVNDPELRLQTRAHGFRETDAFVEFELLVRL